MWFEDNFLNEYSGVKFPERMFRRAARAAVVPRMLRSAPLFAAWCAADPGSIAGQ
jgi:hypothetical protein